MNDYARYMKDNGFYVLNYFNVTEFGKNMGHFNAPGRVITPDRKPDEPGLWKDKDAFLKNAIPGAALEGAFLLGPPVMAGYHATATDCGDPEYQKFILEQADRHNRMIPDSFGICIDRLDWLSKYNPNGDDGVSWVDGKPSRALYSSFLSLMDKLGPMMHDAGKVIFVNPDNTKLDWMKHADGIIDEHAHFGPGLNTSAFVCMRKPVITWSNFTAELNESQPDAYIQRHLHMGAYPMAPYPWNHHCTQPSKEADELFLAYGPLLDEMRGKKWVLTPHCVESDSAKVNLFEVPGGYAMPVTFAGNAGMATVRIRNVAGLKKLKCHVIHPGIEGSKPLTGEYEEGTLTLTVPIVRNCAMVTLNVK